jgi:hypothetical protein
MMMIDYSLGLNGSFGFFGGDAHTHRGQSSPIYLAPNQSEGARMGAHAYAREEV